jgi:hypothetical protein
MTRAEQAERVERALRKKFGTVKAVFHALGMDEFVSKQAEQPEDLSEDAPANAKKVMAILAAKLTPDELEEVKEFLSQLSGMGRDENGHGQPFDLQNGSPANFVGGPLDEIRRLRGATDALAQDSTDPIARAKAHAARINPAAGSAW